jgi:Tol biopolymer transport system component
MTSAERFDRRLELGLDDLADARLPDYLSDILATTRPMRQRPAWSFPGRWLPMTDMARRPLLAVRAPSPILLLFGVLLLVAGLAAIALVGSRPAIPPPFGLAGNGALAVIRAGALEIDGRHVGPDGIRSAVFSPDGRSIAYVRSVPGGVSFGVLDAVSGAQRYTDPEAFEPPDYAISWSPDGAIIARESGAADGNGDHTSTVTLVRLADGTKRTLDPGFPIAEVAWRPPDGRELLVRGWKDERAGLYLVQVDGSGVRPVVVASDDLDDLGQGAWSPDGTRIAYVYGDRPAVGADEQARLHLVDPDGTRDVVPSAPVGVQDYWPVWSPDGTRIALSQYTLAGRQWAAIQPVAGGERATETGGNVSSELTRVVWSPDGRQLLIRQPDGHLLLMAPASGTTEPFMIGVDAAPSWQRIAS